MKEYYLQINSNIKVNKFFNKILFLNLLILVYSNAFCILHMAKNFVNNISYINLE
jgi:hypothetical protein